MIVPTADGSRVSANTHDLVYLPDGDLLFVSDVGSATTPDQPGFDADGRVFVLAGAAAAGDTPVRLHLAGPSTLLGNPVGLAFDGESLFVSERARDAVLRFDGLLGLSGEHDLAPNGAVTVAAPEAVVLHPPAEAD